MNKVRILIEVVFENAHWLVAVAFVVYGTTSGSAESLSWIPGSIAYR
jgi:hypothetical protein